ncbi:hypothetical protein LTR56_006695 [Elasticomyces elasticus]|nr:hypothetical protein LTR22_017706 [Elasticomyces elasticus]KAK3649796.1 hypothetical protein LTR56_006695 [Elasticomyces elasticus]KAK4913064.1 hypothetical protein LTR49_018530 [Elasticomyces elasticus]KAK5762488.1 hypothetical protein LTS12_007279 [Elasticomyces elasticus]
MLTIRDRTQADLDRCVEVLQHVYDKDGYPVQGTATAHHFLQHGVQRAWVAEQDGVIIGHAAIGIASDADVAVALWQKLHPGEPVAVLERLFVDPRCRGSGAATSLIKTAVQWSAQVHVQLVLFALVKDQVAIHLYDRLGWNRFGTVPFHFGDGQKMDAICLSSPAST